MSFSENEHPRATDGTFTEKLGSAPELGLSRTTAASAFQDFLGVEVTPHEDAEVYGLPHVYAGDPKRDETYVLGTEREAHAAAKLAVERNLWDVSSSVLAEETGQSESVFEEWSEDAYDRDEVAAYQSEIHELVTSRAEGGVEGFTERFIEKNGRGRVLAAWDFQEQSFESGGETYYVYRMS